MSESAGARVELRGVTRAFRQGRATVTAVADVTLAIAPGDTVAVTGPSGAGKTTLLGLIDGHERPDAGDILVDGLRIDSLGRPAAAQHRRHVGFVFQDYRLLDHLTVLDNVLVPVVGRPIDRATIDRALGLLAEVGLADTAATSAGVLSGGQRQRVAIARALITHPRLLLADEPTGALDTATGEEILDVFSSLHDELGFTMILATHDPSVAPHCRRIVGMRDGAIVSDDDTVLDIDREWLRVSGTP